MTMIEGDPHLRIMTHEQPGYIFAFNPTIPVKRIVHVLNSSASLSIVRAVKSRDNGKNRKAGFWTGLGIGWRRHSAEGSIMAVDLNEMNKMFVVEWNPRQKQFQIQALGKILKSNLRAAVNGRDLGYVPVAIATTEGEALKMSKLIETKLKSLSLTHRGDSSDTLH